jgi:DNA-binding NarL/FixJ family response regulator
MRPRVLLADDHTLLLEAFAKMLEPEFLVVGTVADGRALISTAAELKPDVIVLDIAMPLLNGLDAARQINRTMPSIKLVFLTMNEDPNLASEAFRAGASGYLLKTSAASELTMAIKEALGGRSYITPLITQGMVDSFIEQSGDKRRGMQLTPRQREVLQLLAEGHSMKEAAKVLEVTPRTVAFHKYRIMEQLQLKTNAELFQLAIREGLIPMERED